ncbi:fibronectin type III domain-containing protein [Thiocapsa bogorovii]|uniref:fibronectin type III domain-containing protein n=1 Tax=Thiocapsa bogorovii TaxID=521689 RepID=UPI001E544828|nr:fibronectin type III domain-containing protein [Thiocapsa bogorovii]UHD14851.1 fibronectin type III domain-containing protein [Thiocapsa bogorovii]
MRRTRALQVHLRTDIYLGLVLFAQLFLLLLLSSASGLSGATTGSEVKLVWNAVNDSRVARYEVHYGTASKTYDSNVQVTTASATVSGLEGGSQYFFATRACTSDGELCSAFSNEVNVDIPGTPHSASGVVTMRAAANARSARRSASVAADNTLSATRPAIEIGEVEINQEWQWVEFQRAFVDPVVVVKALSN